MKTITIIKVNEVREFDTLSDKVLAFENEEEAKQCFEELISQYDDAYQEELEEWEREYSDCGYCIYDEGDYFANHVSVTKEMIELN